MGEEIEYGGPPGTKGFWDGMARRDHYIAILDIEETRDPERRDEAFEAAGREDARTLSWFVHPRMRVVDLGCGIGRVLRYLAPHCSEIVGIDVSEEMAEMARAHLEGVSNASVVVTDGGSLPGIEDGSVDFLYSLLCLIHVDRRSAYRYLLEMRRALRPGALAHLQFHDILTPLGLAKFQRFLDADYPLEFYSRMELEQLLAGAGLELLSAHGAEEYVFLTVVNGSAEEWKDGIRKGITVDIEEASGLFAEARTGLAEPARLVARVSSTLSSPRTFQATTSVISADRGGDGSEARFGTEAIVQVDAGGSHTLEIRSGSGGLNLSWDGEPAAQGQSHRSGSVAGAASVHAGLLPSGFPWCDETLTQFPNLFLSRSVELIP